MNNNDEAKVGTAKTVATVPFATALVTTKSGCYREVTCMQVIIHRLVFGLRCYREVTCLYSGHYNYTGSTIVSLLFSIHIYISEM